MKLEPLFSLNERFGFIQAQTKPKLLFKRISSAQQFWDLKLAWFRRKIEIVNKTLIVND